MACASERVWMIRNPDGELEVATLDRRTALLFRDAGWKVQDLPLAAFSVKELRILRAATKGSRRRQEC